MAIKLADTARPNNYVDAEHLGTYPVAYAEDVWFEDGTRLSEKTFDGQSIQKEELPLASADELGNIYQYVGETGTYTNGRFYKCILNSSVYSWSEIKMVENPVVYSETVPDINAYETGSIVCYTGEDNGSFEKGHLYKRTEGDWIDIGGGSKLDNVFLVKDSEGATTLAISQRTFTGTQAEWDALTNDEKSQYTIVNITDDTIVNITDDTNTDDTNTNGKFIDITSQCTIALGTAKVMKYGQLVVINGYVPKVSGSNGFREVVRKVPVPISNGTKNSAVGNSSTNTNGAMILDSRLQVNCSTASGTNYSIIYLTNK